MLSLFKDSVACVHLARKIISFPFTKKRIPLIKSKARLGSQ